MKVLVLGGGAQGSAAAYDLLREPDVESVVLADHRPGPPAPFLQPFVGDRLSLAGLDASRDDEARGAMAGRDVVLCALPFPFNYDMARLAVEVGAHFADLGGNTDIVERQRTLDGTARSAGVSVVPDCGLAPGMVNILAQAGIDALAAPTSVRMWVGGLPQNPLPPLNYQVVYSLEGVLDYYSTPGAILSEGELVEVEPLTGLEEVEFPAPLGTLEAFFTAGGSSTLPQRYRGKLRSLEYRTLRYPGHAAIMKAFRDLGFLDETAVRVKGQEVVPRDLFIHQVSERLRRGDGRDLVALRVEVRGEVEGRPAGVRFELLDRYDEATGMTAMMRCTGFSLAVIGLMQGRGQMKDTGVRTGDEAADPEAFIAELVGRGIGIRREELRSGG